MCFFSMSLRLRFRRNSRRRGHTDDSTEHHDPYEKITDILDLQRQSARRGDQSVAG